MTARFIRRTSRVALVGGAAMAAVMLAACGNGPASGGQGQSDSDPIVLGMLTPLSGSSSAIGPYMKNGAQLAVGEINGKGGVNGRRLELKVEDEACDVNSATAGADKPVTEGVKISVGGYCSSATLARIALLASSGQLGRGQVFTHDSVVGTRFSGRVVRELEAEGHPAYVSEVRGMAYRTGEHRFVLEPDDPVGLGLSLR